MCNVRTSKGVGVALSLKNATFRSQFIEILNIAIGTWAPGWSALKVKLQGALDGSLHEEKPMTTVPIVP